MAAYYCVWVARDRWLLRRSSTGSELAQHALGDAVKNVCALPSTTEADAGVLHAGDPEHVIPFMLEGPRPRFLHWSHGELLVENNSTLEDAQTLGPEPDATGDRLMLSVDADTVERLDAAVLGAAVYRLLDNPHERRATAGETDILRGATVAERADCLLVFVRGAARAAVELTPAELTEARSLLQPSRHQEPHPAGCLSPVAARFFGPAVDGEDAVLAIGRNSVAVLFGRNGAGKTVFITALRRLLAREATPDGEAGVAASLMLQAADQRLAPRQFALLLTHLTFQPLSDVPESALASGVGLRGWNSFRAFDPAAEALAVREVVEQPLADLQDALTAALTEVLRPLEALDKGLG